MCGNTVEQKQRASDIACVRKIDNLLNLIDPTLPRGALTISFSKHNSLFQILEQAVDIF